MRSEDDEHSLNDSAFGRIISEIDYERFLNLQENFKKQKILTKQLSKKIFALAQKTIEIQEKKSSLKKELKEEYLKQKNQENKSKEQRQKLQSQIKRLNDILIEKEKYINELTNSISDLNCQLKIQEEKIFQLKENMKVQQKIRQKEILQLESEKQKKNEIQEENKYLQSLIKELDFKLIGIFKKLSQLKASCQPNQKTEVNSIQQSDKKVEDIYQSIIMEEDSEIKMITENLAEIQNSVEFLMKIDPFLLNCKHCNTLTQQLSILETQNATLHKRISNIEHTSSTELNMEMIRKKFSQILSTQGDNYEIDEKLFNLKKSYQEAIEHEYHIIFFQLFKNEDHSKEVMEQVVCAKKKG